MSTMSKLLYTNIAVTIFSSINYRFLNVTSVVPSDAFEIPTACLKLPRQI